MRNLQLLILGLLIFSNPDFVQGNQIERVSCTGLMKMFPPPEGKMIISNSSLQIDLLTQEVQLFVDEVFGEIRPFATGKAIGTKIHFSFNKKIKWGDLKKFEARIEEYKNGKFISLEENIEGATMLSGLFSCKGD